MSRLLERYPDRVPIIVDRPPGRTSTPPINRHKYLVPKSITMGNFFHEVRKHIEVDSQTSLFFFVGGTLISSIEPVSRIYERYRSEDGFLYVTYAVENTFGA